jgi:hypothetical protein
MGEQVIRYVFECPVKLQDNVFTLEFNNPRVVTTRVNMSFDPAKFNIRGENYLTFDVEAYQSVIHKMIRERLHRFEATLIPTRRIVLEIKPQRQKKGKPKVENTEDNPEPEIVVPQKPRFVTAALGHTSTIEENQLSGRVQIQMNIRNKELSTMLLPLPADVDILNVRSDKLEKHEILRGEDGRFLKLRYKSPRLGNVIINFDYESVLPQNAESATIPCFTAGPINRFKGFIAVESLINADITVEKKLGLTECDPSELRIQASRMTTTPVIASFSYSDQTSLTMTISRHEALAGIPLTIINSEVHTCLDHTGRALHQARYMVKNNGVQFLDVRLPDGARLASARVGNRMVRCGRAEEIIKIPLMKSRKSGNDFQAFLVEIIYFTTGTPFKGRGEITVELPRVDSIISNTYWKIGIPDGIWIFDEKTTMYHMNLTKGGQFFKHQTNNTGKRYSVTDNTTQTVLKPTSSSSTMDSTSSLPISVNLPTMNQHRFYSQETIYSTLDKEPIKVKLRYLSIHNYTLFHLVVFFCGILIVLGIAAMVRIRKIMKFRLFLIIAFIIGLQIPEYYNLNANEYGLLGVVITLTLLLFALAIHPHQIETTKRKNLTKEEK